MVSPGPGRWYLPALAAGASLLLFFGPWLIPVVGALLSVWTPAPLLVLYRRQGPAAGRLGLGLTLVGAVLVGALFSAGAGGLYVLFYAAVALVLGEAPRYRLSEPRAVALAAFAAAGAVVGLVLGAALFSGQNPLALWEAHWNQELQAVLQAYDKMGLDEQEAWQLRQGLTATAQIVLHLAPGLLVGISLLLAWGNLLAARRLVPWPQSPAEGQGKLSLFKLPEVLVWVVILAGAMVWAGQGWWLWTGVNVLVVMGVAYFFQGMAVLAFWLEKKNAPRLLRFGLYVLLAMEVFLALLVALAGLFDIWFNFRRLGQNPSA